MLIMVLSVGTRSAPNSAKPSPAVKQEAGLLKLHDAGGYTMDEMAELFSTSRSAIYWEVERGKRKTIGAITP